MEGIDPMTMFAAVALLAFSSNPNPSADHHKFIFSGIIPASRVRVFMVAYRTTCKEA
jgi:hypothetical protein